MCSLYKANLPAMSLDIDEKRKEVKNGKEYIKPTNVNIKRHDQVNKKKTATEKNDVDMKRSNQLNKKETATEKNEVDIKRHDQENKKETATAKNDVDMKRHDQVNKKETATAKNDVDMKRHDQENKKETATAKNDVDMKRHNQVNKKETATEKKEVVKKSQGEVENGENANETEIDETMAAHTGDAFIAGWVGGAASVLVSHPLDTVKVRLQTNTAYKGAMDCAIKTFTKEGVRGFYKGMSFPLASAAAYNALVFGIYSNTTKLLCYVRYGDSGEVPRCSDIFIAAMAAGGVSVSVGTPIDLIKIRLQTQTDVKKVIKPSNVILPLSHTLNVRGSSTRALATSAVVSSTVSQAKLYAGPIECAGDIYRQHGLKGLYRGGAAMLMRDIPGYALYFIPYELIRAILTPENGRPGVASALLAGGLAGTLSWGLMNPMDTIKSRLQADIGVKTQKYEGVIHCLRSSYKSEGYSVLFRGMGMNALRGFPQSAALFFGYETAVSSILRLRGQ